MKTIFKEFTEEYLHLQPKDIVGIILDNPQGRKAFETYRGNEFDLRHEVEEYRTRILHRRDNDNQSLSTGMI